MSIFRTFCIKLGLAEEHVSFKALVPLPRDVLLIPAHTKVEGQIHTEMTVVVAGNMDGTINIRGDAKLLVLERGEISNGLVSANCIELEGSLRNAAVDVDKILIGKSGRITEKSRVRYNKLAKHEDAPISGTFDKRAVPRDGYIHVSRPSVDALDSNGKK